MKSEVEQYGKLRDYAEGLKKFNPNSSVFIGTDHLIFQNMYVCIDACKRGFLAGCRPLVGLDGCFLKGGYKAQLLVVVGIDPNDCIFPIAYGVVDVESKESWTWFVRNLSIDLNIENSGSWTFMSDKEKGLIAALDELMPSAEKRFCIRHLWKNLCKTTTIKGGPELKDLLWNVAKATYPAGEWHS
ncbi:uncharacterized protein LOC121760648 [Salvia splendens]|uniref:uncharacterized protein LOC121760648 n=1 Tax=Salvia splendens TaxID=180675 RepID=UPI001C2750DF|nr:uncharacterized protein LOC121760648 [Salvia splendens]